MENFTNWLEHKKLPIHLPTKPLEKNPLGGFDPETDKQKKLFKKVDLITLPEGVEGTNCSNCKYVKIMDKIGFCQNDEILQYVTPRNCCAYWDHDKARRSWEK